MSLDHYPELRDRPEGRRWFVVQCQPRKEVYAQTNLKRQDFHSFLPRFRKTVRHARKTRETLAPLFPRYLFVSLDLGRDRWRSVLGTYGVTRLVTDGFWPAPVPQGLVEDLVAATEQFGAIEFSDALTPGEKVRFLNGPFAETIGRLVRLDDAGRAQVLLELLGSEREVSVSAATLAPVLERAAGSS